MEGAESFFHPGGKVGCLLLHGLSSSPFVMRELGERLASGGITVAAPLLAGHGTSPEHLSGTTWRDWVDSAEEGLAELREHGCERIYLVGLSLGAAIALYLAGRGPYDYAGIVAMSAPLWLPRIFIPALHAVSQAIPYFDKRFSDIADPEARKRQLTYERVPLVAVASLTDFLTHVRAEVDQISAPALIVYARKDHLVHPLNSMQLYSRIASKDKSLQVLHQSYHIVTVDLDKEIVFAAVEKFIRDREPASSHLLI